jgi:hypothetical protein
MPEISNRTLLIAISAVAAEIRALRKALAGGEPEPEDYEFLEGRIRAAEELERAYEIAARTAINLTPYDELVGGSEDE